MLRLERSFRGHADVVRLVFIELSQLHADAAQVQTCDLFIQVLRQDVNVVLIVLAFGPKFDLRQNLVGERRGHHEGWMARRVAEIQ